MQHSPFGFSPPLVPVLESQNFLDVQLVFARTAVLRDLADQYRDFRDRAIHPVEQAQLEGHRDLPEPLRPIRLDLAVFDLLGVRDDLAFTRLPGT